MFELSSRSFLVKVSLDGKKIVKVVCGWAVFAVLLPGVVVLDVICSYFFLNFFFPLYPLSSLWQLRVAIVLARLPSLNVYELLYGDLFKYQFLFLTVKFVKRNQS